MVNTSVRSEESFQALLPVSLVDAIYQFEVLSDYLSHEQRKNYVKAMARKYTEGSLYRLLQTVEYHRAVTESWY